MKTCFGYNGLGLDWIDAIPDNWKCMRIKRAYKILLGKMLQNEPVSPSDTLAPYLRSANITWNGIDTKDIKEMWFSTYEKKLYRLKKGDLVVCEGGDVGRSALWNDELDECYIQNAVHIIRPIDNNSNRFLYYWMNFLKNIGYIDLICNKATIAHLTAVKLAELPVVIPPPSIQKALAVFLGDRTSKIDALITKKERLVELLQEKRTALISQAVTKGLDPNVPMKDSGVEWLGEIPEHWKTIKLKYLAVFYGGGTPSKDNINYWTGNIPWVSPKDMKNEFVDETEDHITEEAVVQSATRIVPSGSVLVVVRSGILAHTIPVAINRIPVALNQDMKAILPNSLISSEYLALIIRGLNKHLLTLWRKEGTTVESIEIDNMLDCFLPIPPIQEQNYIYKVINEKCLRIDAIIAKLSDAIDKLREYKISLISNVITGKVSIVKDLPKKEVL